MGSDSACCLLQVLVLAPTREIAVQIHSVVLAVGCAMEGLQCHVFIGGRAVSQDKSHLKKCHIAVGSPGQTLHTGTLLPRPLCLLLLCCCNRANGAVCRSHQAAHRAGPLVHLQHPALCSG